MAPVLTPGRAISALGAGHAVWGLVAYRDELREIARAGYVDSVGDGLFRTEHSRGGRAAAFWFMAIAPLAGLTGYMTDAALRAADRRAAAVAGASVVSVGVLGAAAIPRSGFPAAIPIGIWTLARARRARL